MDPPGNASHDTPGNTSHDAVDDIPEERKLTAKEKKERQAAISADFERRVALAMEQLAEGKEKGDRSVTAASVANNNQLHPSTISRKLRGGRGRSNRVMGLVSTAPAHLNSRPSDDPFIACSSVAPSTAPRDGIADQAASAAGSQHTPTSGPQASFASSRAAVSRAETPVSPSQQSAAVRVYQQFNLPASSPPRWDIPLPDRPASTLRSHSVGLQSPGAQNDPPLFSSPATSTPGSRPIRPLPTPKTVTPMRCRPALPTTAATSSPNGQHPRSEPSEEQILHAFEYHMSDALDDLEDEEDELVDWAGGDPFSETGEMTELFRGELEIQVAKAANDRRNRRRRRKITEQDLKNFMVYLDQRDVPLGTFLSALLVSESRSEETKGLVTRWLRSPTTPELGAMAPYDQCLKRVLNQLDFEACGLVKDDYFRVNTTNLREEDVTEYKPAVAIGRITSTRTIWKCLRAITGRSAPQPPPKRKRQPAEPEIIVVEEDSNEGGILDDAFERLDGVHQCMWDGEDEWKDCDCSDPSLAIPAPALEASTVEGDGGGMDIVNATAQEPIMATASVPTSSDIIEEDRMAAAAIASAAARKRRLDQRDPRVVALYSALSLLFARNRQCNRLHMIMGLYHYAARTSRRGIETLSRAGLCVSYLTIRRAALALAADARKRLVALLADPAARWVLCYDNLNWMNRVKAKSTLTKSTMQAAVHGNIIMVNWTTAYKKVSDTIRICSAELFKQMFGPGIRPPTETPQSLFDLARPETAPKAPEDASKWTDAPSKKTTQSLRSRHFQNLIEDSDDEEQGPDIFRIDDEDSDRPTRPEPSRGAHGAPAQAPKDVTGVDSSSPLRIRSGSPDDLDNEFFQELSSSPARPLQQESQSTAPSPRPASIPVPSTTIEDVDEEADALTREKQRRLKIREESDSLRQAPLPAEANVKSILGNDLERDHAAEAILSHAYNAWFDLHPEYAHLKSKVPEPHQILPLQPKKSNIRPLPVLDEDEATVIGNIKVIQEFLKHIGLTNEDVKGQIIAIIADVYTVEKITSAQHRRRDDFDDVHPEIERLSGVRVWPAFFHTQMALLKNILVSHHGTTTIDDIFSTRKSAQWAGNKNLNVDPIKYHDGARYILNALFPSLADSLITPALNEAGYPVGPGKEHQATLTFEQIDEVARATVLSILIKSPETLSWSLDEDYDENPDLVYLHGATLFRECGIFVEFNHAIRSGDLGRIIVMLKQMLPLFQAGHQPKYVNAISELLISMNWESHPELILQMLGGSIVNRDGEPDNFVPTDLHQEQDVMALKHTFPLHGMNGGINQKAMLGSVLHVFRATLKSLNQSLHIASQNNKHTTRSMVPTCNLISSRVNEVEGFTWIPGRQSSAFEIERTQEYSKLATDQHAAGMAALIGTKTDPGVFPRMKARRAVRISKTGTSGLDAQEEEVEEGEDERLPASSAVDSGRRAGCADEEECIGRLEDDML